MKYIIAVVVVCIAAVQCQIVPRPAPSAMPVAPAPAARPRGCSPGCGQQEICAKLGQTYCRPGQSCLVCVEMSSIRFPSAALSSILGAQRPPVVQPQMVYPQQQQQQQQQQQGGDFFSNMFGRNLGFMAPMMFMDGFGF